MVPPIIAAMPINAHSPVSPTGSMAPNTAPSAPPMMSSGASTPPEVPDPKAIDQMTAFTMANRSVADVVISPCSSARDVVVADAERVGLDETAHPDRDAAEYRPPHPMYRQALETDPRSRRPSASAGPSQAGDDAEDGGEQQTERAAVPRSTPWGTAHRPPSATGARPPRPRRRSQRVRSCAVSIRTAAARPPAAWRRPACRTWRSCPAAAPATSSVLRSAFDRWKSCANSEPNAPPVMMIGPSAPNGPPVPMEIAEDSGFRIATFG